MSEERGTPYDYRDCFPRLRIDPILRAALAAHDMTFDDLEWHDEPGEPIARYEAPGLPTINMGSHVQSVVITWPQIPGLDYLSDEYEDRFLTADECIPETLIDLAEGRLLRDVMGIPGAEDAIITQIVYDGGLPHLYLTPLPEVERDSDNSNQ